MELRLMARTGGSRRGVVDLSGEKTDQIDAFFREGGTRKEEIVEPGNEERDVGGDIDA